MNGTMLHSYHEIEIGQALLIACCAFYLIWWSLCYRPGFTVSRMSGGRGALLAGAALTGVAGTLLSVMGARGLAEGVSGAAEAAGPGARISGGTVLALWACAYALLFVVTYVGMKRPVTTELVLITGWAALEVFALARLSAAGRMKDPAFWILTAVIAACFVISMVFYVLYYRMEEWRAYYMAMVPLVTEAAGMAAVLIAMAAGRR